MCRDTVEVDRHELCVYEDRLLHTHHEDILAILRNRNVGGGDRVGLSKERNYDSNDTMCPPPVAVTIWDSK